MTCAEATHTELEVGGVYYGEVKRENGQVLSARLYDCLLYTSSNSNTGIQASFFTFLRRVVSTSSVDPDAAMGFGR